MTNPANLAQRIEEARLAASLRVRRHLSQSEMAELIATELGRVVWQQQWSAYEAGKSEPPLDVIRAAAKLSGLTPGYLAFGEEANTTMTIEEALATARRMPDPKKPSAAKTDRKKGRKRP